MAELLDLDAVALAEAVRTRQASPVEIVEQALAAIEARDKALNSVVVVLEAEARRCAREAERAIASGRPLGPLHGVPVTVKEPIWVAGAPATNGSRALADFRASSDAPAVARMRRAGAIVIGKTNVPEMQFRGLCENPINGLTRNPWDLTRTSGGSSGGAAVSVAAGIAPLALGSDGGGSIRIPASFCGVAGLKPSRGLVPTGPNRSGVPSLTVIGPLARSVRDLGLILDTLAGPDAADDCSLPALGRTYRIVHEPNMEWARSLRVAYSADLGFAPCSDGVRAGFETQIEVLRAAGWNLEPAHPEAGDPTDIWYRIFETELYAANRELLDQSPELIDQFVRRALEPAASISAHEYLDAQFARTRFTATWERFFERFDVLLTPGAAIPAFEAGQPEPSEVSGIKAEQPAKVAFAAAMLPANVTGNPALALPSFFSDGMPVGLQMIARRAGDDVLLRAGAAYEAVRGPLPAPASRVGISAALGAAAEGLA